MTCKDLTEFIEPIAAGDVEPDAAMRGHLETCPPCAAALASARRLEAALAGPEAPAAPARFTSLVLQRVRRERWRLEQNVDRLFNVAIVAALLIVVGGLLALMNLSGVVAGTSEAWTLLSTASAEVARQAVPSVNTYAAAGGLLATALGMWWWAERRTRITNH
jgi:anti-sigma factor RsiW